MSTISVFVEGGVIQWVATNDERLKDVKLHVLDYDRDAEDPGSLVIHFSGGHKEEVEHTIHDIMYDDEFFELNPTLVDSLQVKS